MSIVYYEKYMGVVLSDSICSGLHGIMQPTRKVIHDGKITVCFVGLLGYGKMLSEAFFELEGEICKSQNFIALPATTPKPSDNADDVVEVQVIDKKRDCIWVYDANTHGFCKMADESFIIGHPRAVGTVIGACVTNPHIGMKEIARTLFHADGKFMNKTVQYPFFKTDVNTGTETVFESAD